MKGRALMVGLIVALGLVAGAQDIPAPRADAAGRVEIRFPFKRQPGLASNQFAVWIEDDRGAFVKTLFATRFTARGGYKKRPQALSTWVRRSALEEPPDAVSAPTPRSGELSYVWDCRDRGGSLVPPGEYRFFVEGTLFWESLVLWSGRIVIGGPSDRAVATPEYSSEADKNRSMIGPVEASYIP